MTPAAVRTLLRSSHRNVLVEAPAGCGKTYEAAELAVELGRGLADGANVLVLAHTNAAVQEFLRRIRNTGARVRATTIDAFCLDLLEPYATRLGLPNPIRRNVGVGTSRLPFAELAPRAANLLTRCPAIAGMLAFRFPFVILDEHQDTSLPQHNVVKFFCHLGQCRVRLFGDPMQAIYEGHSAGMVSWDQLSAEADIVIPLDTARRWREHPELGDWLLHARGELRAGRVLPLRGAPPSVRVRLLPQLSCAGFGHGNVAQLGPSVREFARNSEGTTAILSRYNNHVWGLHVAASGQLRINEGVDFESAYALLEHAAANASDPRALALCLVDHIQTVATGLDRDKRRAISSSFQADRIDYGHRRVVRDFLSKFEPIYRTPDVRTFCEVTRTIVWQPPPWLKIRMPASMRLVGQVRPRPGDDPAECLDEAVARLKAGMRRPTRTLSTIHKAKGLEFDNVLISNFSAAHFPDDEMSRRIAYVALSRARRSVALLVPGTSPSALLG